MATNRTIYTKNEFHLGYCVYSLIFLILMSILLYYNFIKKVEHMATNRTIYTKNEFHLGDCVYSLIYLKNICSYIEENNIIIYFYCLDEYLEQVKDFNNSKNIIVEPTSNIPNGVKIHNLWIGSEDYDYNWFKIYDNNDHKAYDVFFCNFYNKISQILEIPVKIDKFIYYDNDLIDRCKRINFIYNNYYSRIDFLINNGRPMSGQFYYDDNEWNNFIIKLSKKHNVVTTQKVADIKCTRDFNLKVKDIAAISLEAKNIIAIESGVVSGFYNVYVTEDATKTVYTLSNDNAHKCSFKNFTLKNSLRELDFLLDN